MSKGEFIIPPSSLHNEKLPLVFLAGPVQGAPDHQREVGEYILQELPDGINVASPRGNYASKKSFDYTTQVDWEEHHLMLARDFGVISFNFEARDLTLPHEDGRSYAKTSRLELMKLFGWLDYNEAIEVAVRFDPAYQGESQRYIERELEHREIPIFHGSNQAYGAYIVELIRAREICN